MPANNSTCSSNNYGSRVYAIIAMTTIQIYYHIYLP